MTVTGTVVGTSSDSSVATDDVTTASSDEMNTSAIFESYQPDDASIHVRRVTSNWDASSNSNQYAETNVEYEEV